MGFRLPDSCLLRKVIMDAPEQSQRESPDGGKVVALPIVGGLHHRYTRVAA